MGLVLSPSETSGVLSIWSACGVPKPKLKDGNDVNVEFWTLVSMESVTVVVTLAVMVGVALGVAVLVRGIEGVLFASWPRSTFLMIDAVGAVWRGVALTRRGILLSAVNPIIVMSRERKPIWRDS